MRTIAGRISAFFLMVVVLAAAGCGGGGGGTSGGPGTLTLSDPPVTSTSSSGGLVDTSSSINTTPRNAPTLPSTTPPVVGRSARAQAAERTMGTRATVSYNLPAGWSAISFPFASLSGTSGFAYQLYRYDSIQGWITVDPTVPSNVDTRLGYLAYTDNGATVTATGTTNSGTITSTPLAAGWNLVGCPAATAVTWANATFTRLNATRVLEDAARDGLDAADMWMYRYALNFTGGTFVSEDLLAGGSTVPVQGARFVWAWQGTDLNLNVAAPSPVPSVSSLSATSLAAGGTLTINGTGFGTIDQGQVAMGGIPVSPSSITSWTTTRIVLTVPSTAVSGLLVVFNNRYPSNRTAVTVSGGSASGTGTVSATITDASTGSPVSGAQLLLDNGQCGTSSASGTLTISNVPVGQHIGYVTVIAYQTAVGQVTVEEGRTTQVNVGLYRATGGGGSSSGGSSSGGGSQTGTLTVVARQYTSGATWWPSQISVHEYGNYSNRWNNSWGYSSSYETLNCSGAVVGRTYAITITWQNDQGQTTYNTWYRTLYNTYQTETFYSVNG